LKPEADEPRENTIILLVNKVLMARTVPRTVMLLKFNKINIKKNKDQIKYN